MNQLPTDKSQKRLQKAVIYLRVSTEEQVENYSLGTQEEACVKEAQRRDVEVLRTFREEGRSAKTIKDRPALIELLEFCRKNKKEVDAVIVYRIDRISRQTSDYLAIRKKLAECDITLISTTEPTGNKPADKFIETMLAGFAQMDNDVRSERTKTGMRARFLSGLYNGPVPLGYLNRSGYATKDPATFDKMKAAWDIMATGTKTLREMAEILTEQGVREKQKGHTEKMLRPQTLNGIFRNKFYMGKIVSQRYSEEVIGQHAPMVTEGQFYRVQAILDGRNTNAASPIARRSQDNPDFPLRRLVKCARCGQVFTGSWSKGRTGQKYAYYFCRDRCETGKSVASDTLFTATKKLMEKVRLTKEAVELCNSLLRTEYHERSRGLRRKQERADVDLQKVYQFRQALIEKNLAGIYSDDVFKEQNKFLEEKLKLIHLSKSDNVVQNYHLESITEFVETKLGRLDETFQAGSLGQQRVLLVSIFPNGLHWDYPGYSKHEISPNYRLISRLPMTSVQSGGRYWIQTSDLHNVNVAL